MGQNLRCVSSDLPLAVDDKLTSFSLSEGTEEYQRCRDANPEEEEKEEHEKADRRGCARNDHADQLEKHVFPPPGVGDPSPAPRVPASTLIA